MNASYDPFPSFSTCLISRNILEGVAAAYWIIRRAPQIVNDTGWQILSAADTTEYLAVPGNLVAVDSHQACALVPALFGILNFPVGSELSLYQDGQRQLIVDSRTGTEIHAGQNDAGLQTHSLVPAMRPGNLMYGAPNSNQYALTTAPRRKNGRYTAGIILTVLGGAFLLSKLLSAVRGSAYVPESQAEALGAMVANVLFIAAPLIVGVVLLATSKRKR